jgi:threonine dehydratase
MGKIQIEDIIHASRMLQPVIEQTPLALNEYLSELYGCNIYLKREDLQVVRSFKIRGAYYFMRTMSEEERRKGVVCASAGNHAQGVAYSCKLLGVEGKIFMPKTTPRQKVSQVQYYGGSHIEVLLVGDTFDDSFAEAVAYSERENKVFIHPFDHPRIIAGQGTIGMEIMQQTAEQIDYLFAGIGGGGLISGVGTYIKTFSPETKVIGVEPEGAPAMLRSREAGRVVTLDEIDKFVDGAAVKRVGELTFDICRSVVDEVAVVPEGAVCSAILDMYNRNAIVVEPAGALPVAALSLYREEIKGKNVVCLLSGGNNDIDRMQDIKERSLIHEGLKHYFIVNFPQRAGALREFLAKVLGPTDDITRFEYMKKNNRDNAPAIVGIELKHKEDYEPLIERLRSWDAGCIEINRDPRLFNLLV